MLRDASQLTGSVTVRQPRRHDPAQSRLNSPLFDTTDLQAFSQEIRLSSSGDESPSTGWSVRSTRTWIGATARTCRRRATMRSLAGLGLDPAPFLAPPDTPFFSDSSTTSSSSPLFGEGHLSLQRAVGADGRRALLRLRRRPHAHVPRRVRRYRATLNEPGSTSSDGFSPRADPRVRAERRRAVHRAGRAWLPPRRHQRSAQRRPVPGRHARQRPVRRLPDVGRREGHQLRAGHEDAARRRPRHLQRCACSSPTSTTCRSSRMRCRAPRASC